MLKNSPPCPRELRAGTCGGNFTTTDTMCSVMNPTAREMLLKMIVLSLCILCWRESSGAVVVQEDFGTDPRARDWRAFGDTNLHRWNASQRHLEVTWDSSHSNSFFARPLGTILSKADDFAFSFDLRLADIRVGSTPNKPAEFQIAVGLMNSTNLTSANYFAGTGHNAVYGIRNAVEFNYFPDAGFGETFASIIASSQNNIYYVHNIGLAMTAGDTFRVTLACVSSNQLLRTTVTRNGAPYGSPFASMPLANVNDFRIDTFAVINYSDAVQAGLPGSVLAHGIIDNVTLTLPFPPVQNLVLQPINGVTEARFNSATNWSYRLERSLDLANWQPASAATPGNGAALALRDNAAIAAPAFYRIQAQRP